MARFSTTLLLSTGLLTLAAACNSLPEMQGQGVTVTEQGSLLETQPNDIVVAPLIVDEGVQMPQRLLREAFVKGLVQRHYAPLALDYIDAAQPPSGTAVTEASYMRGSLNEDAVLQIIIHEWDESLWKARQAIEADMEIRLENPVGGAAFWAARFDGRMDFADRVPHHPTAIGLRREALETIAMQVLSQLPEREARPGTPGGR